MNQIAQVLLPEQGRSAGTLRLGLQLVPIFRFCVQGYVPPGLENQRRTIPPRKGHLSVGDGLPPLLQVGWQMRNSFSLHPLYRRFYHPLYEGQPRPVRFPWDAGQGVGDGQQYLPVRSNEFRRARAGTCGSAEGPKGCCLNLARLR